MPFTSLEEVIPTINEFLAHWPQVNTALGATPLSLPGGYVLATLTADRDNINTLITAVTTAANGRQIAASDRDIKKATLRERLRQFRGSVQGRLAGSVYVKALPKLPATNAKEQDFLRAMDDMRDLWTRINAAPPAGFTGPLLLTGAYAVATFTTDVTALRTQFAAVTTTEEAATFARKTRDAAIFPVKARLVQYRQAVVGAFLSGHALIASLPAVSPSPGSTPDPVSLSASWNVGTSLGNLVWGASLDPDLDHYSVRYHPGPRYKASEEQSVSVVASGLTSFATAYGLPASGSTAWFKVYVVTSTGNEKGSNAVKVIRP